MTCDVTKASVDTPGNTHACSGNHQPSDVGHFCPGCRRWFGVAA